MSEGNTTGRITGLADSNYRVISPILKYFEYAHLPEPLQEISKTFYLLANTVENNVPDGPEKSAGLRKLLEAKDCFVRAKLP